MTAIEVTGKTLDEAKRLAAEKLGVDENHVSVTVLEEAKGKGLFGQSKVRIRAEATNEASSAVAVVEAPSKSKETTVAPLASEDSEPEAASAKEVKSSRAKKVAEPKKSTAPKAPGAKKEAKPAAKAMEAVAAESNENEEREAVIATEEDAERLVSLLREFMQAGELEVTAHSTQLGGRYVTIELDGKDVAFLVGKHGEVLNALQYLMNIIAGRKFNNGVRATLDGNDYRHRREEALTKLATNIANEVKNRGEEAVLDALPAFERRIVHKALSDFEGIATYSEGEEPNRRVVIAPAD